MQRPPGGSEVPDSPATEVRGRNEKLLWKHVLCYSSYVFKNTYNPNGEGVRDYRFIIHRKKQNSHPVQFSRSVMSDSLWSHEQQHARPPCPSPTPRVHPNPCLLSRWCYPTTSPFVVPFSSCPQSFPASGSFQMSLLFTSGGQSIGVSASTSVLPMNTQDWFPLEWTGWISLQSKGLSRVFSNTTVQKHQFFGAQLSL